MIAYIVTSGSYSDYGINAVFTTEALADEYCKQMGGVFDVEEWQMDEHVGKISRKVFTCFHDGRESTDQELADPNARTPAETIKPYGAPNIFCARSFVSAEHARKLMFEEHQRILREKAQR